MSKILQALKSKGYHSVFLSIEALPAQILSVFNAKISLPLKFKNVNNVVLAGMGGSALSAHIIKAFDVCQVPFSFYNDYMPPLFVSKQTLFIASSYSGNTEEVVASLIEAEKRQAKIIVISAGGKLEEVAKRKKYPFIKFNPEYNPSNQPRYGLGYGLGALLYILISLNLTTLKKGEVEILVKKLKSTSVSEAESLAKELNGFAPIFVASEFLLGNAHVVANQINETCKTNAYYHAIPELNHHLLEGLKLPDKNISYLKFVFLESKLYNKKIKMRYSVTKEVVKKNKIKFCAIEAKGKNKLEQMFNILSFCSMVSLILAIMYKEDPTAIPFVDYFKQQLKKMS